ncbi:hypothetical protein CNMCM5793_006561 [Aspergillus hiratsukae]|uniref:Short chain dehydrogenase/reductase family protein n=1 Tax=Aspergillus hiratsukae TaxID=1194566 RepID=A0A8H6QCK0_9EURO|nr:hypothetical protein CNMCM5793_006561 [Aspergillus hiratsukae]KAF7169536.1 hypothetical protein CNMCM6106_004397 [Aspergillus hiratsukae]
MSLTDSPGSHIPEHQYYSSMDIHASPPKTINALSPSASAAREPKLQLPSTTDPPGPQNPPKQLIFGATGHMGRSLVKTALSRNDLVSAVGRTFENSPESMAKLEEEHENCLGLLCDVRARETVQRVIERTITRFGRIDIVANCAGYGVIGACEDQDEYEIRDQFETNFTGTLNMIQLSLPHFRERGAGRYLIFSSTSGALGVPGLGPYCASKYAVEGLMESMLYEVDSFNIKGTLVEPGHMRRDDVGDLVSDPAKATAAAAIVGANNGHEKEQNLASPLPLYGHFFVKQPSEPYNSPTAPAAHAKRMLMWLGDKQPASAVKAAHLVWQLGHCSYPPLRLILGTYAVESIRDRLKCIIEEIEDWKYLSFPVGDQPASSSTGKDRPSTESRDKQDWETAT